MINVKIYHTNLHLFLKCHGFYSKNQCGCHRTEFQRFTLVRNLSRCVSMTDKIDQYNSRPFSCHKPSCCYICNGRRMKQWNFFQPISESHKNEIRELIRISWDISTGSTSNLVIQIEKTTSFVVYYQNVRFLIVEVQRPKYQNRSQTIRGPHVLFVL